MSVELSSVVCQCSEGLAVSDMNGEVVMMTMEEGNFYNLDDISSRIWSLMEGPIAVADICLQLQALYDVAPGVCERDVLALINDLSKNGLVKTVASTS